MKIALYGGSFDPIHREHIAFIKAAKKALSLDKVILIPSFVAPHKPCGAFVSAEERLNICALAVKGLSYAEVSDFEISRGERSYSYITAECFHEKYPKDELFFLVGADMLEDFFNWKNPERILACATLAACSRGNKSASSLHTQFVARFGVDYKEIPFSGAEISSTALRVKLAFGMTANELPPEIERYIKERGLYSYPVIKEALALEKEERRSHSFRVAMMAVSRARSMNISEEKALLAAALHDAGKYVPPSSELLKGFSMDEEVPAPVLHQYTGAYLAERVFGIRDEEILDAIRYHTSGREDMTPLGKLIFLADLLESGRSFEGIEELRRLFWIDLDECLLRCFEHQFAYLEHNKNEDFPVYPLTKRAYKWLKEQKA